MFDWFSKKKPDKDSNSPLSEEVMQAAMLGMRIEIGDGNGGIKDVQTGQMLEASAKILEGLQQQSDGHFETGSTLMAEALGLLEQSSQPDGPSFGLMVHSARKLLAGIDDRRGERLMLRALQALTAEQALEKAELYDVVAAIRKSLGNDTGAIEAMATAVKLMDSAPKASITDTLRLKHEYGRLLADYGEPAQSVAVLTSIKPNIAKEFGEVSEENADLLDTLALGLLKSDKAAEALNAAQQSLELFEELDGENSPRVARVMGLLLATIYRAMGQADMREVVQRRAEGIYKSLGEDKLEPGDAVSCSNLLSNIATTLTERHDYDAAERYLERSVDLKVRTLGEGPSIIMTLSKLASVCGQAAKFPAAEKHAARLVGLCRTYLGDEHPRTRSSVELQSIIRNDSRRNT
jgi:tetratricopeptide (TPR) repeat protein